MTNIINVQKHTENLIVNELIVESKYKGIKTGVPYRLQYQPGHNFISQYFAWIQKKTIILYNFELQYNICY